MSDSALKDPKVGGRGGTGMIGATGRLPLRSVTYPNRFGPQRHIVRRDRIYAVELKEPDKSGDYEQ